MSVVYNGPLSIVADISSGHGDVVGHVLLGLGPDADPMSVVGRLFGVVFVVISVLIVRRVVGFVTYVLNWLMFIELCILEVASLAVVARVQLAMSFIIGAMLMKCSGVSVRIMSLRVGEWVVVEVGARSRE